MFVLACLLDCIVSFGLVVLLLLLLLLLLCLLDWLCVYLFGLVWTDLLSLFGIFVFVLFCLG